MFVILSDFSYELGNSHDPGSFFLEHVATVETEVIDLGSHFHSNDLECLNRVSHSLGGIVI